MAALEHCTAIVKVDGSNARDLSTYPIVTAAPLATGLGLGLGVMASFQRMSTLPCWGCCIGLMRTILAVVEVPFESERTTSLPAPKPRSEERRVGKECRCRWEAQR